MENKITANCRLCLELKEDCVQIKESHWSAKALQDIFEIKVDLKDGLSKEVCDDCLGRTSAFYNFYLEVKANQAKLKPLAPIKIKEEAPDSSDTNHVIKLGPGIQIRVLEGQPMQIEESSMEPSMLEPEVVVKEEKCSENLILNMLGGSDEEGGQLEAREVEPQEFNQLKMKSDTKCDLCSKTFTKKYGLQRHLREVHYWSQQIKCHVCHKIFGSEPDLDDHMKIHENVLSPMTALYCDLCERYFSSQASIQKHVGTMHNDLRPYSCDLCCKKFKQFGHLQTHKKTHMAEKPLKCGRCDARFKILFNLRRHEKLHEKWDAKEAQVIVVGPNDGDEGFST